MQDLALHPRPRRCALHSGHAPGAVHLLPSSITWHRYPQLQGDLLLSPFSPGQPDPQPPHLQLGLRLHQLGGLRQRELLHPRPAAGAR